MNVYEMRSVMQSNNNMCVCVCVCRPTLSQSCCHHFLSSMIHTINTQTPINVDLHHSFTHTFSMSVLVFDVLEYLQFIVWILQFMFEQLDSWWSWMIVAQIQLSQVWGVWTQSWRQITTAFLCHHTARQPTDINTHTRTHTHKVRSSADTQSYIFYKYTVRSSTYTQSDHIQTHTVRSSTDTHTVRSSTDTHTHTHTVRSSTDTHTHTNHLHTHR